MNVTEIMSAPVYTVQVDASVVDAANIMLDRGISTLPVLNERGRLVGIVSHSNFFLHPIRDPAMQGTVFELFGRVVTAGNLDQLTDVLSRMTIANVMAHPVVTVPVAADINDVVRLMNQRRIKRVPVVRDDEVVGIVTRHDFLRLAATGGLS